MSRLKTGGPQGAPLLDPSRPQPEAPQCFVFLRFFRTSTAAQAPYVDLPYGLSRPSRCTKETN